MSKIFSVAVFVAVVATLLAMTISAMPVRRPPTLVHRARPAGLAGTEGCIDNITAAGVEIGEAVKQIFTSVSICKKPNNTANCVASISTVGEDLTRAATDISLAINACAGTNTQCATDLTKLATDLADAARRISGAVASCSQKEIGTCIEDIVDEVVALEDIIRSIVEAVSQCKQ